MTRNVGGGEMDSYLRPTIHCIAIILQYLILYLYADRCERSTKKELFTLFTEVSYHLAHKLKFFDSNVANCLPDKQVISKCPIRLGDQIENEIDL